MPLQQRHAQRQSTDAPGPEPPRHHGSRTTGRRQENLPGTTTTRGHRRRGLTGRHNCVSMQAGESLHAPPWGVTAADVVHRTDLRGKDDAHARHQATAPQGRVSVLLRGLAAHLPVPHGGSYWAGSDRGDGRHRPRATAIKHPPTAGGREEHGVDRMFRGSDQRDLPPKNF